MNITLVGPTGRVGSELFDVLKHKHSVNVITRIDCDLNEPEKVGRLIRIRKPHVVINAAAYNGMEPCDKDPMMALEINAIAPAIMAAACKDIGARFIHYSTDYVFSGHETGLYENTPTKPSGRYGWSKLKGEEMVSVVGDRWLIFRLSSIYGRSYSGPIDPINQVLQGKGTKENPIKVLHQFCAPTSAREVAIATQHVIEGYPTVTGLFHLATSEGVWKKDFAKYIIHRVFNKDFVVEEGTLPVPRPVYTQLISDKFETTFKLGLRHWESDFEQMLKYLPNVQAAAAN